MTDLMSYIDRGGIIVYILLGINIFGFAVMLWKLVIVSIARFRKEKAAKNALDFMAKNNSGFNKDSMYNAVEIEVNKLESGLSIVRTIATIAPLLGLLGTVYGVLNSFDAIAEHGLGDPTIFSKGISIALITTVAGLIVAIPHYVGYNYFVSVIASIELKLKKEILEKI